MYKIIYEDGITLINDNEFDLIKENIKKTKGYYTNNGLNIYTSENGSKKINDLNELKIEKVKKNEEKLIKDHYPMLNFNELKTYIDKIIEENNIGSNNNKNIDFYIKQIENRKFNCLLKNGKTAEDFSKLYVPEIFYDKLLNVLLLNNEYDIIESFEDKYRNILKNNLKNKLSDYKDIILNIKNIPKLIVHLENDLKNDDEIKKIIFDQTSQFYNIYKIGIFLPDCEKEYLYFLLKDKKTIKEFTNSIQSKIKYSYEDYYGKGKWKNLSIDQKTYQLNRFVEDIINYEYKILYSHYDTDKFCDKYKKDDVIKFFQTYLEKFIDLKTIDVKINDKKTNNIEF